MPTHIIAAAGIVLNEKGEMMAKQGLRAKMQGF